MKYRFHPDIVYTRVCGVSMLIALRGSWGIFPPVQELSPLQGCFCYGIESHMEEDELIDAIRTPRNINKEVIRERFHMFVLKMLETGCLIPDENTSEETVVDES